MARQLAQGPVQRGPFGLGQARHQLRLDLIAGRTDIGVDRRPFASAAAGARGRHPDPLPAASNLAPPNWSPPAYFDLVHRGSLPGICRRQNAEPADSGQQAPLRHREPGFYQMLTGNESRYRLGSDREAVR